MGIHNGSVSRVRRIIAILCVLNAGVVHGEILFDTTDVAPGNLRFTWIHGSLSAKANTDVRIQVHRYNEHTYILRQNPAVHWEAPFMYLLMGNHTAVLLDAGALEEAEYFPLREVVERTMERWMYANDIREMKLVVLPLGNDPSQTAALEQFGNRPDTVVVPPEPRGRREVLGTDWPQAGRLDLGGRELEVLATPGLDAAAVTVYDPWSRVLFTGNAFYPGRLVIRDFTAYKSSLRDLAAFKEMHPVRWIWGGRIEMTAQPGLDYILRTNYRPNEHPLELSPDLLDDALQIVSMINGSTDIRIHDDFIVMHGVGRGARDYGWPVFIPERFRELNTR